MTKKKSAPDLIKATKRSRQIAAGVVRQALLSIDEQAPFTKETEQQLWADREALETAFSALTAPTPPAEDKYDVRSLDEELDFYD